ncbi:MAG: CorA family divalent cation transporter [Fimbriimonadales bacterium]
MRVAEISFARFVYPFVFEENHSLERIIDRLKQAGWTLGEFPESDLLPHVRDYLNAREGREATAHLLEIDSPTLVQLAQRTLATAGEATGHWQMHLSNRQLPFVLEGAQLAIFRGGVAFLTLDARPTSDVLADWLDFVYHFRAFAGEAGKTQDLSAPTLCWGNATLQGIKPLIDALLVPIRPKEELFMRNLMLPFTALFVDGELSDADKRMVLYRVRLCFSAWHEVYPPESELRPDNPYLMAYAQDVWFTFAQQAAGFVAFNAPGTPEGFFRNDLPKRLRNRYFLLYLLTLHQKFMLMYLSDQVSESWLGGDESQQMATYTRILNKLLEFTARGYFAQVMQQEQHHRYYCRWRETLQLETLYQEVSQEVREIHSHLQLRLDQKRVEQSERLNRVVAGLTYITVGFALPSLFVSFLGANVRTLENWEKNSPEFWWAIVLLATALVSAFFVIWINWLSRRSGEQ